LLVDLRNYLLLIYYQENLPLKGKEDLIFLKVFLKDLKEKLDLYSFQI